MRGGRWYYSRNSGLQRQNAWYSRPALDGPETLVPDPNAPWPEGDVALTSFSPSPDGRHVAFGEAVGGADLSGWTDEIGRWLILTASGGTDRNTLAVKDLRDPMPPDLSARIVPIVAEPDATTDRWAWSTAAATCRRTWTRRTVASWPCRWPRPAGSTGSP